jgi:hypothetical protein
MHNTVIVLNINTAVSHDKAAQTAVKTFTS